MSFLFGVGALFAAFLIIDVFRRLLNRPGARFDPEAFGASEAVSLGFTGLTAFGVVSIVTTAAHGRFPAALAELALALGALAVACAAAWFLLNRILPAAKTETAATHGLPPSKGPARAGRTAAPSPGGSPAATTKRAA